MIFGNLIYLFIVYIKQENERIELNLRFCGNINSYAQWDILIFFFSRDNSSWKEEYVLNASKNN